MIPWPKIRMWQFNMEIIFQFCLMCFKAVHFEHILWFPTFNHLLKALPYSEACCMGLLLSPGSPQSSSVNVSVVKNDMRMRGDSGVRGSVGHMAMGDVM